MRIASLLWCVVSCLPLVSYAEGPADRKPTDPHSITSASSRASTPLPVEALLTTTHISRVARSNDGRRLAYISTASGRPNLWIMNVDGSGAQQLVISDDRQAGARFTH